MIQRSRRAAKAIVAWGVPTAAVLVSLGTEWTGITDDGIVSGAEWQGFAVAIIAGVLTYFKTNAPPA